MATKRRTLDEVVEAGSRHDILERLRLTLVESINAAEPQSVAALVKELRAVMAELDAVKPAAEVSKADELAARRSTRRADPSDRAPAARRRQPRRSNGSHRTG